MLEALIPSRSAEDFASGIIRVTLGRQEVILEELPMEQMDAWSELVDGRLAGLLAGLDDGEELEDVLGNLADARPLVLDTLATYPGVPPIDELRKSASHAEVLRALMGVWSAANPLVATLIEGLLAVARARTSVDGDVSGLMSTLLRPSDGASAESDENSPTESSSPAPMPPSSKPRKRRMPRSKPPTSGLPSPDPRAATTAGAPDGSPAEVGPAL